MKASYVFGILFVGALTVGCVAQTGTEDVTSNEQGLTVAAPVSAAQQQEQQQANARARVQLAPQLVKQPVHTGVVGQELEGVQELSGADPGAPVQDDGDGKEPDPHPWHTNTAIAR
jgi:hypothetical protein